MSPMLCEGACSYPTGARLNWLKPASRGVFGLTPPYLDGYIDAPLGEYV